MNSRIFVLLAALCLGPVCAVAQEAPWRHGAALLDEPKYPAGFKHFDYVNPNAPRGGLVRLGAQGTFDSFNIAVAGVKGTPEQGIGLVFETLTTASLDEPSASYGLLAEAFSFPADFTSVSFRLRPEARWHDGRPVTADDVIFSFEVLKENSPTYAFYYKNVVKAEKLGEREVRFSFDEAGNRELPQIMGQLTVLPKHWWEGTAPDGRKRDVTQTTLEPPLGSGPYRVKSFEAGRTASYERVPDYWGANLNVNVGQNNFDEIRYEYYRDGTVLLEAFKGDRIDFRSENSARAWATGYDFPARKEGRVVLEEFPIRSTGVMQAFVFNLRRDKFKDPRVRRAFNYAFDFEDMNRALFFGQYKRINSYFEGLELASSGLPEGQERVILEIDPRQGARKSLHDALSEPGRRFARGYARKSARGRPAPARGRLGIEGPTARQCQGRDFYCRAVVRQPQRRAHLPPLQGRPGAPRPRRQRADRRRRAACEQAAFLRLRRRHVGLAANRSRPETSSANSGVRVPPTGRARAISPASPIPALMR